MDGRKRTMEWGGWRMMEYISDPDLFKAVSFAASMIKMDKEKGCQYTKLPSITVYQAAK